MNKEKILRLADRIENSSPEQFHMGSWFGRILDEDERSNLEEEFPINADQNYAEASWSDSLEVLCDLNLEKLSCGTTACIAGWALLDVYFSQPSYKYTLSNGDQLDLSSIADSGFMLSWAKDYLGLTDEQAHSLFYCFSDSVWNDIKDEYDLNFNSEINATWSIHPKVVADVLRRIVDGSISL